ncbi:alpha-amylase family protein [Paenibacillus daejeonensis]|uniref:alpha-amylase family protein n=1 Tax=Paenibacillus daejeonensis TaxID=135193 RepID=UPI0003639850|nr:alpha-amylase family protein [Paenibacillus daejeonensis]
MSSSHIILYDPNFPGAPQAEGLGEALASLGRVTTADDLAAALDAQDGGSFINLHAPYFPKAAWSAIIRYLEAGGGLVSVGAEPFRRPVSRVGAEWTVEAEQTAYHRALRIHEMLPVDSSPVKSLAASEDIPLLAEAVPLLDNAPTWNMVPHVTKSSDLPHQMGSAGPMDARLHALVKGVSAEGREVAAPVVLWENTGGSFAGSRWLFVNQQPGDRFWQEGGIAQLLRWADYCGWGVTEVWLKPGYASYEPGERPMLTLQYQQLGPRTEQVAWTAELAMYKDGVAEPCWRHTSEWTADREYRSERLYPLVELEAGYYRLECQLRSERGERRVLRQGIWGMDRELLQAGEPVACGRDYFIQDGRPMPVVGMTYMTSDVARKFLFLPNAAVWDKDMAQMAQAGINWIRTGVWTAYRNMMQVDGHASEEVLRALDAFILTAKRHGLQLTFTFFSFTPETWEGVNPYLDPRSVEAQKRFIRAIVSRHQASTHVDWDLINEPSMFDPARIFSDGPRTCGDRFEQAAYSAWLQERHGDIRLLQERWNMTAAELPDFSAARPPEPQEINMDVQDMHQGKRGTRILDYTLFSMAMHNRWARELTATIKEICPDRLVTVGQDEALGAQRPSPLFYGQEVDYTTVHSWWLNDQLLWDGIFAKTLQRPNLVQETGIMYVETPDGRAKRTEAELRAMLERKYAYAFAAGGAGAVQWIWNTNYYMDNANESHIGALRADGTEKPEADVSYRFGSFMREIRDLLVDRELEQVAVVYPYSNDFSNRPLAFEATTRLTRVLGYELKVPFLAVSEYGLDDLEEAQPRLIIVPSPHNFDSEAFDRLMAYVRRSGAVLLWTGPLHLDAYWRETSRLAEEAGAQRTTNVVREEVLALGGELLPVSYSKRRIAETVKSVSGEGKGGTSELMEIPLGAGRLLWCALPLELNDRSEPLLRVYRHALAAAGVQPEMTWLKGGGLPGVYGRRLTFAHGSLYVFISEYAADAAIEVRDEVTGCAYSFELTRERSVLFATDAGGELLAVYRPDEVEITVAQDRKEGRHA